MSIEPKEQKIELEAPPDYHHVSITATKFMFMKAVRNPAKNIKMITHVKTDLEGAKELRAILDKQIESRKEGAGPVTFDIQGEFTRVS